MQHPVSLFLLRCLPHKHKQDDHMNHQQQHQQEEEEARAASCPSIPPPPPPPPPSPSPFRDVIGGGHLGADSFACLPDRPSGWTEARLSRVSIRRPTRGKCLVWQSLRGHLSPLPPGSFTLLPAICDDPGTHFSRPRDNFLKFCEYETER